MLRTFLIAIALAALGCPTYCEETAVPAAADSTQAPVTTKAETPSALPGDKPAEKPVCAITEFFRGITGEWVGVCKQTTEGEVAEDKYFRACIRESSANCFEARFEYYRCDAAGALVSIGGSDVKVAVSSDCTAVGRVVGDGEVLVDKKPKKQEHDLTEALTWLSQDQLQARGTGSLKVYGMPLGLGKLGKVRDDQSAWKVTNGALNIKQSLSIVFKALCFSKSFTIEANYAAVRGSEVSSIVPKQTAETVKSGG